MSLKKILGIISVIIIVVFSMMLTTSYAWYAFDNASTSFSGMTSNDDIIISYQKGEYINTNIAVPISSRDVARYSDKNNFNIDVKKNVKNTEIAVTISLVEISIDRALQDANFKVDLYYQGSSVTSIAGNTIGIDGDTTQVLKTITLNNDVTNMFEIRVYLLDDGTDQTALMNRTFSAKIQIDVVSRLKTNFTDYKGADILVSSITIDGEESNSIPTSGYYDMTATCTKGSTLTWEPLSKTITYASGSYINDNCSLTFSSSTDYPLLSEMPVGSYVKYVGSNGCDGKSCEGQNANYVSDTDMGYCDAFAYKFHENGWRIGYIKDGSAVIVSAGSTDCMCTNSDGTTSSSSCSSPLSVEDLDKHYDNMDKVALKYCNSSYTKGGVCDEGTSWAMDVIDFEAITGSVLSSSSCYIKYSNMSCGYTNDLIDNGGYYWFATRYSSSLNFSFNFYPNERRIGSSLSSHVRGVRPVIYFDSSVIVTGGNGTYKDPYLISNS